MSLLGIYTFNTTIQSCLYVASILLIFKMSRYFPFNFTYQYLEFSHRKPYSMHKPSKDIYVLQILLEFY